MHRYHESRRSYILRILRGIGDEPLLDLSDVTVDSVVAELYDGGTISLAWRCRLSHVEPETSGALHALLRQDIDIEIVPPEAEPELVSQDEDEA